MGRGPRDGERKTELSGISFYMGTNYIIGALPSWLYLNPVTSKNPSRCRLELQHMNRGVGNRCEQHNSVRSTHHHLQLSFAPQARFILQFTCFVNSFQNVSPSPPHSLPLLLSGNLLTQPEILYSHPCGFLTVGQSPGLSPVILYFSTH